VATDAGFKCTAELVARLSDGEGVPQAIRAGNDDFTIEGVDLLRMIRRRSAFCSRGCQALFEIFVGLLLPKSPSHSLIGA
jgi:hypothetical protein